MASRPQAKFNFIKGQIERDKALIPARGGVGTAVAASFAGDTATNGFLTTTTASSGIWVASHHDANLQRYLAEATNKVGQWVVSSSGARFTFSDESDNNRGMMPTHEKMKGKDRPWAAELLPHWERARKLNLTAQKEAIEKMVLRKDIEELTKGAGYPEVTDRDLEAMFEFPRLRRKVRWHNLKAKALKIFANDGEGAIVLRLKKDSVERSGVAIPFGAQLRLEEAKEKAIFEGFQVVYPSVITEAALAAERARERDPALVGLYQGAMFLICSWDLPLDVKKAEADMEALKALKIEG